MQKKHRNPKQYRITKEVCDAVCATIGANPPEQGGFLGSSDGIHIDHYYFDSTADTTASTYTPDTEAVNAVLCRWEGKGVELVGNIHSHPFGFKEPSQGDIAYARRIMKFLGRDSFLVAILIQKDGRPDSSIYPFTVYGDGSIDPAAADYEQRYVQDYPGDDRTLRQRLGRNRFVRIEGLYPMDRLRKKTVVVVGVGGAVPFVENLARSGVSRFILFDPDIVSATNIATSGFYITDIGRGKVEVARERIYNINPDARVTAIQKALDDTFTDDMFEEILGQNLFLKPEDVLICGCTDSFPAQARTANLAMKYGTSYLAAQLYSGGEAAEIYFSYPGVTNSSCPRCALSSRYAAYENGFRNDVTSTGSPIFATGRLNSLKGQIALMLLLYHEDEHCRFNTMLDQVADRNFLQINMSPTAKEHLKLSVFENAMNHELAFFDETVWIPQVPNSEENGFPTCPLCGGTGDLLALKGKIKDSRRC